MKRKLIAELYIGNLDRYFRREKIEEIYPRYKLIILTGEPSCFIGPGEEDHLFDGTGYMFIFGKFGSPEKSSGKTIQRYLLHRIEANK